MQHSAALPRKSGKTPPIPPTIRRRFPNSRQSSRQVPGSRQEDAMATFELSAHMTIRSGQLEGFKKQAAEIIRLTKEKDTKTLRYDWFITNDGTECEVRELYTSPQGLIEHKAHIGAALHTLFARFADNHFMTIYGEPSPELIDLVKSLHMEKQIKWFSFLKGLEPSTTGVSERASVHV
jgi:quinol monooxygenase YgiN